MNSILAKLSVGWMKTMKIIKLVIYLTTTLSGVSSCPGDYLNILSFILEYSLWKGWQQTLIFDVEHRASCRHASVKLLKCLSLNGVGGSIRSGAEVPDQIAVQSRLGIVVLPVTTAHNHSYASLQKLVWSLHERKINTGYHDWLITARSHKDFTKINKILNFTSIRPFVMSNMTELNNMTLNAWFGPNKCTQDCEIILVQYVKVRPNSTLYGHILGSWSRKNSMSNVLAPYPVEARNFLGDQLVIGRSNTTDNSVYSEEDEPAASSQLDDIMQYLSIRLNFTPTVRHFSKLGYQTYQGAWTGLLGALVDKSLDMVLEPVTTYVQKHEAMEFLIPVADTMCNIYIRHQETSTVRDIFLAPFSSQLICCVFLIVVASAATVLIISRFPSAKRRQQHSMESMEAFLWSAGILCQQGGSNTPSCSAGRLVLIACLMFAVVIYNAYAAFITSVLSVRVASLDTIDAVLQSSNIKIGYIKNGADQNYLMSTKDVQLNAFYIRGYSNAENLVTSAEEGLQRAVNHDYAFFAGQRAARFTLVSFSQDKGRCALRELPLPTTKAHLSFPIARKSPYARLILINLLQLKTRGSLKRLESALVPPMPFCDPPKGFTSARATDVRSALILIGIGLIAAFIIGTVEYCWKRKAIHKKNIKKVFNHFKSFIVLDFDQN